MELSSIEITKAENGCIVRCTYKKTKTKKDSYDDYETKTYTADESLLSAILESVGEEVKEEKSEVPREKGMVTKIRS